MVVRLSALQAGRPLPLGRFLVLSSVRGLADPRAIVRLEGLGQLKNPMISCNPDLDPEPEVQEWLTSKCTGSVVHEIHAKIKQGGQNCFGYFNGFVYTNYDVQNIFDGEKTYLNTMCICKSKHKDKY
jgi:hypothetical protein